MSGTDLVFGLFGSIGFLGALVTISGSVLIVVYLIQQRGAESVDEQFLPPIAIGGAPALIRIPFAPHTKFVRYLSVEATDEYRELGSVTITANDPTEGDYRDGVILLKLFGGYQQEQQLSYALVSYNPFTDPHMPAACIENVHSRGGQMTIEFSAFSLQLTTETKRLQGNRFELVAFWLSAFKEGT